LTILDIHAIGKKIDHFVTLKQLAGSKVLWPNNKYKHNFSTFNTVCACMCVCVRVIITGKYQVADRTNDKLLSENWYIIASQIVNIVITTNLN